MDIREKTFNFSLLIMELCKNLSRKEKEFILSRQLLRAGTSIGAQVEEAQAAQSKKDFVAKMAIASKEARETNYWLRLLEKSNYLGSYDKSNHIISESNEIIRMLTKIVKTSMENLKEK